MNSVTALLKFVMLGLSSKSIVPHVRFFNDILYYPISCTMHTIIEKTITNTDFLLVNPFDVILFDGNCICTLIHCTLIGTFA